MGVQLTPSSPPPTPSSSQLSADQQQGATSCSHPTSPVVACRPRPHPFTPSSSGHASHALSLSLSLLPYPLLPVPGAPHTLSFSFSPSLLLTSSSGCTFAERYLLRLQPRYPLQVKRQTWETKLGVGLWQWVGYRN